VSVPLRVLVAGAGGVGGYVGARLAEAGHDVTFLARGRHLAAIREHGLALHSVRGDAHVRCAATDDPEEAGPVDAVLVCVKSYDTAALAPRLAPVLADGAGVVSLQNGVDNEDVLAESLGGDRVLGGVAYIFSTITEPGVVTHTGGPASVVLGERDGRRSARAERLHAALTTAGVDATLADDVRVTLWTKLVFLSALTGTTAATRLPLGEIRAQPESWDVFRRLAEEVAAVGRASGVPLPDDVVDGAVSLASGLEAGATSSLSHDLVSGHRMELDALQGSVVRRGDALGVDVPVSRTVHGLLAPWAARAEHARG
jgi:2-dehydropantoate 2-reductase